MLPAKDLISSLFHEAVLQGDVIRSFDQLCSSHLNYRIVKTFREGYQFLSFYYSIPFEDSSTYEKEYCYLTGRDFAHFAKPTILGKKEGLVIETLLDGWIEVPDKRIELEKLRVIRRRIYGYGNPWDEVQTKGQLREDVLKELEIPRASLKVLSESDMNSAVERYKSHL